MGWAVNARDEILEKHLFVNEGEMSSKNSFEFGDFACFKMRKLLLAKSQLLLASGEAGGAWRTVLAG